MMKYSRKDFAKAAQELARSLILAVLIIPVILILLFLAIIIITGQHRQAEIRDCIQEGKTLPDQSYKTADWCDHHHS